MVFGAEIAPDLPSAAGRADGSDRPARPLRQAGLLALVPIAPSARCEERPQPGPVIAIARPPAQQAFRLAVRDLLDDRIGVRSEEHTSELQSLMRISYAVFCLKTNNKTKIRTANN